MDMHSDGVGYLLSGSVVLPQKFISLENVLPEDYLPIDIAIANLDVLISLPESTKLDVDKPTLKISASTKNSIMRFWHGESHKISLKALEETYKTALFILAGKDLVTKTPVSTKFYPSLVGVQNLMNHYFSDKKDKDIGKEFQELIKKTHETVQSLEDVNLTPPSKDIVVEEKVLEVVKKKVMPITSSFGQTPSEAETFDAQPNPFFRLRKTSIPEKQDLKANASPSFEFQLRQISHAIPSSFVPDHKPVMYRKPSDAKKAEAPERQKSQEFIIPRKRRYSLVPANSTSPSDAQFFPKQLRHVSSAIPIKAPDPAPVIYSSPSQAKEMEAAERRVNVKQYVRTLSQQLPRLPDEKPKPSKPLEVVNEEKTMLNLQAMDALSAKIGEMKEVLENKLGPKNELEDSVVFDWEIV